MIAAKSFRISVSLQDREMNFGNGWLVRHEPWRTDQQKSTSRDYYMAINFFNFVQQNPDKKIVLWAHNSHLSQTPLSPALGTPPMGSYLKEVFGSAYFPVAFAFYKGSFHALQWKDGKRMGLTEFTVTEAKEGTLDWSCSCKKW